MNRFKAIAVWTIASWVALATLAKSEGVSIDSQTSLLEDTQSTWENLPIQQDDSGTIPITTKQLPPFTTTYEVTLVNWPAVGISVGCLLFCLLVVLCSL